MAKTVAILGAGIQGVCVALMLAKRGFEVELIDKSQQILNRASLNYEGRIHLGLIYSLDTSKKTGKKMVKDALRFAPELERLLGATVPWSELCSRPTDYLVAHDTLRSTDELLAYWQDLQTFYEAECADESLHYLGRRPKQLYTPGQIPSYVNTKLVSDCFETAEVSIDQLKLHRILQEALARTRVTVRTRHTVLEILSQNAGYEVRCVDEQGEPVRLQADMVVNCLWENRAHFDRQVGIDCEQQSIRLKFGILTEIDPLLAEMNSIAIVAGAYGNVVSNPNTKTAFFSWYPSSLYGLMQYGAIPEKWERACEGIISQAVKAQLLADNFKHFKQLLPDLREFKVLDIRGGLILAPAGQHITEDIDKLSSALHQRSESPVRHLGEYYSISTGKYTSAPRNTKLLEEAIFGSSDGWE